MKTSAFFSNFLVLFLLSQSVFAQVTADFSTTSASGCSPLVVNFSDASTGPVTSWFWDFGNGNTSTLQNPGAVYITPGFYTVSLTVSDGSNTNTITRTNFVQVFNNPTTNFSVTGATSGCIPFTTNFQDNSTPGDGTIVSWLWDFGDGSNSNQQNPIHTYTTAGTFSVILVTTDDNGCSDVHTINNLIQTFNTPTASFSGTPLQSCTAPLNVHFNNTSGGGSGSLTYFWDFGDGNTSTATNPNHTYTASGSYDVTLIVNDALGCSDTLTLNNYVVIDQPVAGFNGDQTVCLGSSVHFNNASSGYSTRLWDFGDGTTSTANNPNHTYAAAGTYDVTLIVGNASLCFDTLVIPNFVTVFPEPQVNFFASDTIACEVPLAVNFSGFGTNIVSWNWNFGDGTTDTVQNPSHIYNNFGNYTVTLIATNNNGCIDTVRKLSYIQIEQTTAQILAAPNDGCNPLTVNFQDNSSSIVPITSYFWDFGDGNTSTLQNPSNTFTVTGTYNVMLAIENQLGCRDTAFTTIAVGDIPFANFSVSATNVCPNEDVFFTDLSTNATEWFWDFGDGATSNLQNPSHAYSDTGFFTVTLTVRNNGCPDDTIMTNLIYVNPPIARFNLNPANGCAIPHTVFFTDQSTLPDTWFWDFGDGNTSTAQNPIHSYTSTGTFTVTLIVTDTIFGCSDTTTRNVNVALTNADFTGTPLFGCGPLNVQFTNNSTDSDSWLWDFGDGTTSIQQHPNHTYNTPGTYTVTLTANSVLGCSSTRTRTNYVQVIGPDVNFGADQISACDSLLVNFTDSTIFSAPITSWSWNFGDGNTSNLQNPSHFYQFAGIYDVSLTVTDIDGCTRTFTRNNYIDISNVIANFQSNDTISCLGDSTQFQSTSFGSNLSYLWFFGDGDSASIENPSHFYADTGTYDVTLIIEDHNMCTDTLILSQYINVVESHANFTATNAAGSCPPLLVSFSDSSYSNIVAWNWDFGDGTTSTLQNPSHVYTTAGSFDVQLIVENANGCIDTILKSGFVQLQGPSGSFSFDANSGCNPISVNFQANATNTISYTWDFGDGTVITTTSDSVNHIYTTAGTFYPVVILDDGLGCTFSLAPPDSIVVDPLPNPDFSVDQASLCGPDSVHFTDISSSANPITSWYWDFGDGDTSTAQNPTHFYASLGNYTVTLSVTNSTSCVDTIIKPDLIHVNPLPTAIANADISAGCFPLSVQFSDSSTGATGMQAWNWNFGDGNTSNQQHPQHTFTSAGVYSVVLTAIDANSCQNTDTISITVYEPLSVNFEQKNIACNGGNDGFAIAHISGGDGNYTYSWNTVPVQNDTIIQNLSVGTYTISINDGSTCSLIDSVTISEPTILSANANVITNVSCFGGNDGTATANPNGGSGTYTYSWNTSPIQTTKTATNLSAGTYIVSVTDDSLCIALDTITITQPSQLSVNAAPITHVSCFGGNDGTATANGSGGSGNYSYSWNTSPVQNTQTATNLSAGTYIVTITDDSMCTAIDSVIITEPSLLIANASVTKNIACFGGNDGIATANPSGGSGTYAYSWNTNPIQNTQTATNLSAGTYIVTVTDDSSCIALDTITITQPPLLTTTASVVKNIACFGGNDGIATANVGGGSGTYTYSWNTNPVQNTQTATNLTVGTYTVTVMDDSMCVAIDSITITEPAQIQVSTNVINNVSCYGGSDGTASATASGGSGTLSYSWNTSPIQNTATATNLSAGTYIVTITDDSLCIAMDTVVITEPPALTNSLPTNLSICNGEALGIKANVSGGTPNYNLSWSSIPSGFSSNNDSITVSPNTSTQYILTIIDSKNCVLIDTVNVNVNPLPQPNFISNITQACDSSYIEFFNLSSNGVSFYWEFGDGSISTDSTPVHLYTAPGVYTVKLIMTSDSGCVDSVTYQDYISIYPGPTAEFYTLEDYTIPVPLGESTFHFINTSVNADSFYWDFGVGNPLANTSEENPVYTFKEVGEFYVTLYAYNKTICVDTFILGPFVTLPNGQVHVPNAFTPNGDYVNDFFEVKGSGIKNYKIRIYDRWGEKIFEHNDISQPWDGKYKGNDVQEGVYIYVVEAEFSDGNTQFLKGSLTLMR